MRLGIALGVLIGLIWCELPAYSQKIIVNEFVRNPSDLETDEFIEVVLLQDLTAAELETFYVGDSSGYPPAQRNAAYKFSNMAAIASSFQQGTIIAIGGTTAFSQDITYDPPGGDTNLLLTANGSHAVRQGSNIGNYLSSSVAWVDTTATGSSLSADGFAVSYGGSGAFTHNVYLSSPLNNGEGYALNSEDLPGATTSANWMKTAATAFTPGQPNSAKNATFISALLPVSLSQFLIE